MGEGFADEWKEKYPSAWAWNERVQAREGVAKARDARTEAVTKAH